ncbi:nitroreductase family protein [Actinoallomurus vinaceus]|uniref:Nitroreductase family protein n=1 Tax=Actinoallomurus vinaceus TaxID=1080074 RepID=A0ABP8USX5_9ACTN
MIEPPDTPERGEVLQRLVEAAVWAPSAHDTRPWWFDTHGETVTLHADTDRCLNVVDPHGREMLISCGAALFTLRLAVRRLGRRPEVRMASDPDRPGLIADVSLGPPQPVTDEDRQLYEQVERRRTHRGGFRASAMPVGLLQALRADACAEHVSLRIVADPRMRVALAALSDAAEQVQRMDPAYVAEVARWAPPPGSERPDAVHEEACPRDPDDTEPHVAERDFARGQGWGMTGGEPREATGVVALLTTAGDGRTDWLRAGQALQRVLLRAAEDDVSAAFHTQVLEVPELREFIRTRFCDATYPQMIMRLGMADAEFAGARRPAAADIVADDL